MTGDHDAQVPEVKRLYAEGLSQREVADAFGMPKSTLQDLMRRHGITARPRGGNAKWGAEHHAWKGKSAGRVAIHVRVRKRRGAPARCGRCGTTDPALRYEWANLTGNYADPDDYERMCKTCHMRFDAARRAATGRPTSPWTRSAS